MLKTYGFGRALKVGWLLDICLWFLVEALLLRSLKFLHLEIPIFLWAWRMGIDISVWACPGLTFLLELELKSKKYFNSCPCCFYNCKFNFSINSISGFTGDMFFRFRSSETFKTCSFSRIAEELELWTNGAPKRLKNFASIHWHISMFGFK